MKKELGFCRPFLKMDTQGMDVKVFLSGGEQVQHLVGIQSELVIKKLYLESVDYREAIEIYEKSGFRLGALVPNNAGHFPELLEIDCIMVNGNVFNLSGR